ncbi:MAG: tol-pal system-associated acyl-CoA thioesterase [endosymbiont of Galathealinum brachiosum]|uniref:Tol-pal system-associated acyl-CoA thioesterase n=1 Tax=endosymbiont of Galathealinum brachiosum TaxID=2200906 RepID=A0A370DJ22_9GAMM|nr:MAG: tol-pal system-associated acyl-CoA thioesterase [endosymbiont of Galathealinum brachiosum]
MNFNWPVRVYYEDTDSGGVVYYANYLKFMERARTEFLRHLGFEQDQLIDRENIIFAVRSVQCDYKSPARFNDELIITADLTELKKASMLFEQKIFRNNQQDKILCQGQVRIACLHADTFKPCAIPESIMEVAGVD